MRRTSFLVLLVVSLVDDWVAPLTAPRQPGAATYHRRVRIMDSTPTTSRAILSTNTLLLRHMAPQFDGEKWVATSDEESPLAGYGMGKTLLLQGPKPFLTRLFQPDDYEQAVLKFMATDQCDRNTAQGNMDAYLRNPQDWMYNRMEEEKRGIKIDYTRLEPKEILLVLVWSSFVVAVVGRAVYSISTGEGFYAFGPFAGGV